MENTDEWDVGRMEEKGVIILQGVFQYEWESVTGQSACDYMKDFFFSAHDCTFLCQIVKC